VKKEPTTIGKYVCAVLIGMALYVCWCWFAKILWGLEPPEGLSVTAFVTASSELLGCSLMTAVKKFTAGKHDNDSELRQLRAENKALRKQAEKAAAQLKIDV
jgi:hypothetical protein